MLMIQTKQMKGIRFYSIRVICIMCSHAGLADQALRSPAVAEL